MEGEIWHCHGYWYYNVYNTTVSWRVSDAGVVLMYTLMSKLSHFENVWFSLCDAFVLTDDCGNRTHGNRMHMNTHRNKTDQINLLNEYTFSTWKDNLIKPTILPDSDT